MKPHGEEIVRQALAEALAHTSQAAWAAQHGLSREHVNKVLSGARAPGPKILEALGLEAVYVRKGERHE
jgi:DNA-binding phage protein